MDGSVLLHCTFMCPTSGLSSSFDVHLELAAFFLLNFTGRLLSSALSHGGRGPPEEQELSNGECPCSHFLTLGEGSVGGDSTAPGPLLSHVIHHTPQALPLAQWSPLETSLLQEKQDLRTIIWSIKGGKSATAALLQGFPVPQKRTVQV